MSTSPDRIYEPGVVHPGFPVSNSTKPFWLSEPSKYARLQSEWVDEADIVVIGSGMTAASLTRYLLSKKPGLKIVLMEARDLCSGATGRNGGHIKVMSPGVWFDRKKQYGIKEALRVMEYEHSHLPAMSACIKDSGIECDLNFIEGLDIYHDEKIFERHVSALGDMRQYTPELAARYTVYRSRDQLRQKRIADTAVGAIGMPAGSVWPYKMVCGILERLIDERGLKVQTNTRVANIDETSEAAATVTTDRGIIRAQHVVHATNAWMGNLLPEIRPFVSPVRANAQRQVPSPALPQLNRSYWLRYAEYEYDYMMQRPDGAFIMGRANTGRKATADDGKMDLLPQMHLRGTTPLLFDFGTKNVKLTHQWSGAVAFTEDGNPFVGKLPFADRSRQWICGCYQGIGMVRAFRTAQMLGMLMLGEEVPTEFPPSMLLTPERVQAMEKVVLAASSKL